MPEAEFERRYFVTYRGVKLPSKMVEPIAESALTNRNTYVRAFYDGAGRLRGFEKLVYGEIELAHRYDYDAAGTLTQARIEMAEEDPVVMRFDGADQSGKSLTRRLER